MKRLIIYLMFLILSIQSEISEAQEMYNYTYNCLGCGFFETISSIDNSNLETEIVYLEEGSEFGTSEFIQFTSAISRISSSRRNFLKVNFNIYPNLIYNDYYVNIDCNFETNGTLQLIDLYGRILHIEEVILKKGMTIFNKQVYSISKGTYFYKLTVANSVFVKKILIL